MAAGQAGYKGFCRASGLCMGVDAGAVLEVCFTWTRPVRPVAVSSASGWPAQRDDRSC